jgi:urea-proton symporter
MFCSAFCVGLYPLWEGRHTMKSTVLAVYNDISGQKFHRRGIIKGQELEVTGASTPSKELTEKANVME